MIRISLSALCRILVTNKHVFTIEQAQEYQDKLVYRFMVGEDYPLSKTVVYFNKQGQACEMDRAMNACKNIRKGKVIALYDVDQGLLRAASTSVQTIINEARREAIQEMFSRQNRKQDEFGRAIRDD